MVTALVPIGSETDSRVFLNHFRRTFRDGVWEKRKDWSILWRRTNRGRVPLSTTFPPDRIPYQWARIKETRSCPDCDCPSEDHELREAWGLPPHTRLVLALVCRHSQGWSRLDSSLSSTKTIGPFLTRPLGGCPPSVSLISAFCG